MPPVTVKPDNYWMVEQIQGNPRFIPCALLNPHFGDESVTELELGVSEWGIQGLKLMPTKHGYPIVSKLLIHSWQNAQSWASRSLFIPREAMPIRWRLVRWLRHSLMSQ